MSGTFTQNYLPQLAGGGFQVASQSIGQYIVDRIRKQFPRGQTRRGDFYMDGARHLLQTNLTLIDGKDKPLIHFAYESAKRKKEQLDTGNVPGFRRFFDARKYKCFSKELFILVKKASDRGIDKSLLDQIRLAIGPEPVILNPFIDPPAQPFTGSPVGSLDQVEMTTYQEEATGAIAITLTLHGQDETTQEVIATFSPEVFASDGADHGGPPTRAVPPDESDNFADEVEVDEGR